MSRIVRPLVAMFLLAICLESASMDPARKQVHDFTAEWSLAGPSAWLERLRDEPRTVFYVNHAPPDWIREADAAAMVGHIDSEVPAGVVCFYASAHGVPASVQSTVGHEAAILVDAFRHQRRYPGSCSDLTVVDAAELKRWWSLRSEAPKRVKP